MQLRRRNTQLVSIRRAHFEPNGLPDDVHLLQYVLRLLGQRQVQVQLVDLKYKNVVIIYITVQQIKYKYYTEYNRYCCTSQCNGI